MILFVNDSILVGAKEWLNIIPILGLDVDFEIGTFDLDVVKGMIEGSIVKFGLNLAWFTDGSDVVGKGLGFNDVYKYWDGFNIIPIVCLNVGSKVIYVVGFSDTSVTVRGEVCLDDQFELNRENFFSDVLPVGNRDSWDDVNVEGWIIWTTDGSDV